MLRGEAGIGKSALLGYAAERATGMQVLRVTGMEDESDLAFAGLHGLLWPVVGHLDELPAPQREALAAALGLGPPEGSERFLISAGVLSLLAAAAEERPVVCLIDDAQWLDVPSADAERQFAEAIGLVDALAPFDRARTQLLYGEWLRRERRRTDARPYLRAALETFEQLRVSPWAERARSELRASGETARRRDASTRDQLTPQELRVADLAAGGLTNAEIGAQLFLSPRTIDYHLRKVFSKLEIASRGDLAGIELGEPASH